VDSYDYRIAIPAFSDLPAWKEGFLQAGKVVAIILVPWLIGYHLYQTVLFDHAPTWRIPKDALLLVPYHLFFVAIPEEFFYRGYFQTRLNEVFPRKFLVFGVPIGWGIVLASLFFAFGHSLVVVRWWHFATFFPGLLFGWLREKTGQPLAGALLHAWANVTVTWLDTLYGVI
jgi:membrane protease YdiL (CAAX protease family)